MKLDILLPDFKDLKVDLSGAEKGDLAALVDEILPLSAGMKLLLEKEAKGVLGDQLPLRLVKLIKPAQVAGLLREKRLQAIVGEVVE